MLRDITEGYKKGIPWISGNGFNSWLLFFSYCDGWQLFGRYFLFEFNPISSSLFLNLLNTNWRIIFRPRPIQFFSKLREAYF